jgi:tetratricopeptide (TPR) repeat protein
MKKTFFFLRIIQVVFLVASVLSLSVSLRAVSQESNDLFFIISLYEHGQYNLAKQQIDIFETEYPASDKLTDVKFIKANIAFYEMNYSLADSIYAELLNQSIETDMLSEILINKAEISYHNSDFLNTLSLLSTASDITSENQNRYRIAMIRGNTFAAMLDAQSAKASYSSALDYKPGDSNALRGLLLAHIALDELIEADKLVRDIINNSPNSNDYVMVINAWVDYLTGIDEYEKAELIIMQYSAVARVEDSMNLRLAMLQYLQKDLSAAERTIKGIKTYSDYCDFMTGLILADKGEFERADSIFAGLAKKNIPSDRYIPPSLLDLTVKSWLERVKILFLEDPDAALDALSTYIGDSDNRPVDDYILYVYGSLLFKSKQYQKAADTLLKIKQDSVDPALEHNILIMLADIWFDAKIPENAKQTYSNYLNRYPHGKFAAHSKYNLALIFFEEKDYTSSVMQLEDLLKTEENQELLDKANYLLAEVYFNRSEYQQAINHYSVVGSTYLKKENIDFKMAQCYYYMDDYNTAAGYISQIPITQTNAFPVLLMDGNIRFNLNQYDEALNVYNRALGYAASYSDSLEANSFIALTLYRLRRFEEASSLYLRLSDQSETPQAFPIMAAKSAYHAGDYQQALRLFYDFLQDNPESEYTNNVLANIGSIQYNLTDYPAAVQTWIILLKRYQSYQAFGSDDQIILASVFSGLHWCLKNDPDQSVLDELNDMIDSFSSEYIRFELQYLLLKAYFEAEQWSDILAMADDLRAEFPEKENNEIRRYVASSLAGLDRPAEADSVYRQIFAIEPTPEILNEWADLEIRTGNYSSALKKMNQAMSVERSAQQFQRLITVAYNYQPDSLNIYWNLWYSVLDSIPDRSVFTWLQWNIDKGNWQTADSLAKTLLLNPDYQIRSQSQLLMAIAIFHLGDYNKAVTEFYRAVYLYPESEELVLKAKKYIVKTYIRSGQPREAQSVFNEISEKLTSAEKNELSEELSGIGGN